jgi:hypothetical protein
LKITANNKYSIETANGVSFLQSQKLIDYTARYLSFAIFRSNETNQVESGE